MVEELLAKVVLCASVGMWPDNFWKELHRSQSLGTGLFAQHSIICQDQVPGRRFKRQMRTRPHGGAAWVTDVS